jgi:hypothetical protein
MSFYTNYHTKQHTRKTQKNKDLQSVYNTACFKMINSFSAKEIINKRRIIYPTA